MTGSTSFQFYAYRHLALISSKFQRRVQRRLARWSQGTTSGRQLVDQIEAFPVVDLSALTQGRPVLILAPHADDESLGCGGLIAEMCERGQTVHVVILSDGSASHPGSTAYPAAALTALRTEETRAAVARLGLDPRHVTFLNLPDGHLPHGGSGAQAAVQLITDTARLIGAATVLSTWRYDPHSDHIAAYDYGLRVAVAISANYYAYPVWGLTLTEQTKLPAAKLRGVALDISAHLERKRNAVLEHRSQVNNIVTDAKSSLHLTSQQVAQFVTEKERFIEVVTNKSS